MHSLLPWFLRLHKWLLRTSRGRLGARLGGQNMLLLHTTGRKSGRPQASALSYYRDGPRYLVVASNWGSETPPGWFFNLQAQPRTRIDVAGQTLAVDARSATDDEHPRLWALVTAANAQYLRYQAGVTRRIPVVILTPASS